jgi:hypothetical protein
VSLSPGGDSVLEASKRYMGIWFDQPRADNVALPEPSSPEPLAPGLALIAAIGGGVGAVARFAGRGSRRSWFDPAAMAMVDTLGAAGASAGEIEATIRLRAPRTP